MDSLRTDAYKTGRVEYLKKSWTSYTTRRRRTRWRQNAFEEEWGPAKRSQSRKMSERRDLRRIPWQTIDEQGEPVGVMQNVNFEDREVATERRRGDRKWRFLLKLLPRNVCSSTPVFDLTRVEPQCPLRPSLRFCTRYQSFILTDFLLAYKSDKEGGWSQDLGDRQTCYLNVYKK
jgi:hypothetical protein